MAFGVDPTQWFEAGIVIGNAGLHIPCYAGAQMNMPENVQAPQIMGNRWIFNSVPGLTQPVIEMSVALRDKSNEALSSTFLDYFFARTNDTAYNTSYISGGIVFYDGADAWLGNNMKAESFTIQTSKGEMISMTVRFVGTDITTTSAPSIVVYDDTALLNYANCCFGTGSGFENEVWMFGMSYANNHRPKLALDCTRYPNAQNAGVISAGCNIRTQAKFALPADHSPIPFKIVGANITRNFTINNPICQNPRSRSIQAPEVMRDYQYLCTGGDARTTGPLSYS